MATRARPAPDEPAVQPPEGESAAPAADLTQESTVDPAVLEEELVAAAAARVAAREVERDATRQVRVNVWIGDARGTSENRLAALAGVQRPQIRTWLAQHSDKVTKTDIRTWREDTLLAAAQARVQARTNLKTATEHLIGKVREGEKVGLTQTRIAELCGLDTSTIRAWLGKRPHNLKTG